MIIYILSNNPSHEILRDVVVLLRSTGGWGGSGSSSHVVNVSDVDHGPQATPGVGQTLFPARARTWYVVLGRNQQVSSSGPGTERNALAHDAPMSTEL